MHTLIALLAFLFLAGCTPAPVHLHVRATGEDLGVSLGGTVATSARYGGTIDFARPAILFMQSAAFACLIGDGVLSVAGRDGETRFVLPSGVLVEPVKPRKVVTFDAGAVWARVDDTTTLCAAFPVVPLQGEYFQWVTAPDGSAVKVPLFTGGDLEVR